MRPAALFVLLALLGHGVAAEPLGRLFFTPAERAAADRQRAAQVGAATRTLDGVVTRSNGSATLWIDGQARHGRSAALGIPRRTRDRAAVPSEDGRPILLRVGETMDAATGATRDLVAPGSVRKRP
ncbi:MAG: hypothetical protein HZC24_11880 [Rhodocyclales bacterium]|nr:hypothetical protein [Rhodocyclales bacterium]